LGLAIVTRVAAAHGGTISVDDRPGGGAVFTLRLKPV
jgi:signal transduction histidine kinase